MKLCIVGGGSAIAEELIFHYLKKKSQWEVVAVCRRSEPTIIKDRNHDNVKILRDFDMAEQEDAERFGDEVKDIDLLVTLTGSTANSRLVAMDGFAWQNVIANNLTTVFHALKFGLPNLKPNGSAVIVGSIVGSMGGYGCANYAAAKAGLVGLCRAAANEMVERGIRVNLLELGYVNAGMGASLSDEIKSKVKAVIPLKRFATLKEVIDAIEFLGEKATYMSGDVLTMAGGIH